MKTYSAFALLLLTFYMTKSFAQNYEGSGISVAFASGFGFKDLTSERLNGGYYGKKNEQQDFRVRPIYWSGSFAAKHRSHEFGIEYESLNYKSDMSYTYPLAYPPTVYNSVRTLKMRYFNLYYKFLFPMEFKKITPYLKAGLNLNIYTFREEINGVYEQSSVGLGGRAFSLMAGANYNITDYFNVFAEFGYGPVLCKIGTRICYLPN